MTRRAQGRGTSLLSVRRRPARSTERWNTLTLTQKGGLNTLALTRKRGVRRTGVRRRRRRLTGRSPYVAERTVLTTPDDDGVCVCVCDECSPLRDSDGSGPHQA